MIDIVGDNYSITNQYRLVNISLKSTSQFHEIFTGLFSSRLFDQYLLFSRSISSYY